MYPEMVVKKGYRENLYSVRKYFHKLWAVPTDPEADWDSNSLKQRTG
jgi:hypothetical protein